MKKISPTLSVVFLLVVLIVSLMAVQLTYDFWAESARLQQESDVAFNTTIAGQIAQLGQEPEVMPHPFLATLWYIVGFLALGWFMTTRWWQRFIGRVWRLTPWSKKYSSRPVKNLPRAQAIGTVPFLVMPTDQEWENQPSVSNNVGERSSKGRATPAVEVTDEIEW